MDQHGKRSFKQHSRRQSDIVCMRDTLFATVLYWSCCEEELRDPLWLVFKYQS